MDGTSPKVSVIVTVYNMEAYVKECIVSILAQSLEDIEVVCVEDGSSDRSLSILEGLAEEDDRIKIIHQSNQGLVEARKTGLRNASADYICFVDADDWVKTTMMEELYQNIYENDLDCVSCGYENETGVVYDFVGDGKYVEGVNLKELFSEMVWNPKYKEGGIIPHTVTKIYKKELLLMTSKGIDARIRYGEDNALVYSYLVMCKKVMILHKALYHVRKVANSHSRGKDEMFCARMNLIFVFLRKCFKNSPYKEMLLRQLEQYVVYSFVMGINRYMGIGWDAQISYWNPFQIIEKGDRILIYGAGVYGQLVLNSIMDDNKTDKKAAVIAIIDRNTNAKIGNYETIPISRINEFEYDWIVIALKDLSQRNEVKKNLMSRGISKEKILVELPVYSYREIS